MRAWILAASLAFVTPALAQVRTIDGDTFVYHGETVRIANIDAPEIKGRCAFEADLAQEAKRYLAAALGDAFDVHRLPRRDRYGRTLATISVNGKDVGEAMIAKGLARPWRGRREPWC